MQKFYEELLQKFTNIYFIFLQVRRQKNEII